MLPPSLKIRQNYAKLFPFALYFGFSALSIVAALDTVGWAKIILLSLLQFFPFFRCWRERRMDYPAVILGAQFIGYTFTPFAVMVLSPTKRNLTWEGLLALDYLLLGTALFLLVYYGIRRVLYHKPFKPAHFHPVELSRKQLFLLSSVLLVSFCASPLIPDDTETFWLHAQFLATVLAFCAAVPTAPNLLRITKAGLILGTIFSFISYANLGFAVNLIAIWLIQAVLARTARPLLRLGLFLIPMVAVQSIKGDFRQWLAGHPESITSERFTAMVDLLEQKYLKKASLEPPPLVRLPNNVITHSLHRAAAKAKREFPEGALYGAVNRAHDESLEKVISMTPSPVPFWKGRSYSYLSYLLIPNWLWKNKPQWNVWNEFGKLYGYLAPDDNSTEVVFSYYAEGYMNYGLLGLLLTAILAAVLFAFVEKLSDLDPAGRYSFTFICFLMPLLSYQTAVCSVLAKLIFTALFLGPFIWLERKFIPTRS